MRPDARRAASLDLVQQARAGPVGKDAVAARAQQKRLLQGHQGAVDRPRRGKRAEIVAALVSARRDLVSCGNAWSAVRWINGNDLSSRSRTLKRGISRLIMLHSSSSASASVWVTTISIAAVSATIRRSRFDRLGDMGVVLHPRFSGCAPCRHKPRRPCGRACGRRRAWPVSSSARRGSPRPRGRSHRRFRG